MPLEKVGMRGIETPIQWKGPQGTITIPAFVDAYVNLLAADRGIHMSRLYHTIQSTLPAEKMSFKALSAIHQEFLASHKDLSDLAELKVRFSLPVERKSLKSDISYWRNYKVFIKVTGGKEPRFELGLRILYSSTCPASTALARDLMAEEAKGFSKEQLTNVGLANWLRTEGPFYTPHAQRSIAKILVRLKNETTRLELSDILINLIDGIEDTLGTAVQGAVKRADEQEFTRLNGTNLMFCEDAARKVGSFLKSYQGVAGFSADFDHIESLHPHSAVSRVVDS